MVGLIVTLQNTEKTEDMAINTKHNSQNIGL